MKPKVLAITDHYLPGVRTGGPLRSIANLISALRNDFDFRVLTTDRDWGDTKPYPAVRVGAWQRVGHTDVFYAPGLTMRTIRLCVAAVNPAIVYLNGFFSRATVRTLLLKRLGSIGSARVILSPKGEFSRGALQIKPLRKKAWIRTAARLGLYDDLLWQASTSHEAFEICQGLSAVKRVQLPERCRIARDIALLPRGASNECRVKNKGRARFVFLSRIGRTKNLRFVLEAFRRVVSLTVLHIYGPIDDPQYWSDCEQLMRGTRHEIRYCGPVAPEQVIDTLAQYHFFVLPTLGENFGHAIVEAWAAGCPVLISGHTPWRQLFQKNVGYDLALSSPDYWANYLQQCIDMDGPTYTRMSAASREFAGTVTSAGAIEASLQLFAEAAGIELPKRPRAEQAPKCGVLVGN